MAVRNQNCFCEKIKSRLNMGNACYHAVQNLLSSHLLYRNVKIKIYKTVILPVVLYGCKAWSLMLRKEHRLRVFENRVLWRIFLLEEGLSDRRLDPSWYVCPHHDGRDAKGLSSFAFNCLALYHFVMMPPHWIWVLFTRSVVVYID
jgi:hypothetical protein